jgi:hypothetical protein
MQKRCERFDHESTHPCDNHNGVGWMFTADVAPQKSAAVVVFFLRRYVMESF